MATGRLAITVRPEDRDPRDPGIQRNEIWLSERLWDPMGEESWYGFSFRIERDASPIGDARWVIGQWKEDRRPQPLPSHNASTAACFASPCRTTRAS